MTGWKISAEEGDARTWSAAGLEDDERSSRLPKRGDQIRDLHDGAIVWNVASVKSDKDGAVTLRLERDDAGNRISATLRCHQEFGPFGEEGTEC